MANKVLVKSIGISSQSVNKHNISTKKKQNVSVWIGGFIKETSIRRKKSTIIIFESFGKREMAHILSTISTVLYYTDMGTSVGYGRMSLCLKYLSHLIFMRKTTIFIFLFLLFSKLNGGSIY